MSSKKDKRKPRKKEAKKIVDPFEPIDFNVIGTDNDPCFGKLHSLKAAECQRCGDSELCQMAMAIKMKEVRAKAESKGAFMDLEEDKKKVDNRTFDINGVNEYIWKLLEKRAVEKSIRKDWIAKKLNLKFNIEMGKGIDLINELWLRDQRAEKRLKRCAKATRLKLIKP